MALGAIDGWHWVPKSSSTKPVFRGDVGHKPGSSPIGKPINPQLTNAERAQIAFEHVKQTIEPGESVFKSWSESAKIARDRFARWSPKDEAGDATRVTKVSLRELLELESQGKIKIYSPDQIYELLKAYGKGNATKQANAIRTAMARNQELLIEGEIPSNLQSPLK